MIVGLDTTVIVAVAITSHPRHSACRSLMERIRADGDIVAVTPAVLAEFIHVVTDQRRFAPALDMDTARNMAVSLWETVETCRVVTDGSAVTQFSNWMAEFRLGRKRVLDTMLAATYFQSGITTILTLNPADFSVFGVFQCLTPSDPNEVPT